MQNDEKQTDFWEQKRIGENDIFEIKNHLLTENTEAKATPNMAWGLWWSCFRSEGGVQQTISMLYGQDSRNA